MNVQETVKWKLTLTKNENAGEFNQKGYQALE